MMVTDLYPYEIEYCIYFIITQEESWQSKETPNMVILVWIIVIN